MVSSPAARGRWLRRLLLLAATVLLAAGVYNFVRWGFSSASASASASAPAPSVPVRAPWPLRVGAPAEGRGSTNAGGPPPTTLRVVKHRVGVGGQHEPSKRAG